jgi:hypothetical protein
MCFTARPRMGGRRAVGRWRRGGPRRDRPLKGSRPRPPPEGEGGDEIEFSRAGRPLLGWRSYLGPELGAWAGRLLGY